MKKNREENEKKQRKKKQLIITYTCPFAHSFVFVHILLLHAHKPPTGSLFFPFPLIYFPPPVTDPTTTPT